MPVTCPDLLKHIWWWFLELNRGRGNNGFRDLPLTYTEMLAWSQLTEQFPSPYEVAAIRSVDNVYLRSLSKRGKKTAA